MAKLYQITPKKMADQSVIDDVKKALKDITEVTSSTLYGGVFTVGTDLDVKELADKLQAAGVNVTIVKKP